MDNEKLFLAILEDRLQRCKNQCMVTYTDFLDLSEQSVFSCFHKDNEAVSFLFSGSNDTERKIGVFVPKIYSVSNPVEYLQFDNGKPLRVLKIEKDRFSELSHRDYLGSIMALGIKREKIGDIIPYDKGAYIIVFEEIAQYIKNELHKIGRGSCKITDGEFSELTAYKGNTVDFSCSVASLRLDIIVSTAFKLSRKEAVSQIQAKRVFVNDALWEKSDKQVPVGAKIVLRGKGKAVLCEEQGKTRKDKSRILLKRYV